MRPNAPDVEDVRELVAARREPYPEHGAYPRPLGSVALPLEGDHDEAEWDFAPVVGWARDCDGGGA